MEVTPTNHYNLTKSYPPLILDRNRVVFKPNQPLMNDWSKINPNISLLR